MKKYAVLLIVFILLAACVTIPEKYTRPGRNLFTARHRIIEQHEDLEIAMRNYQIVPSIRVSISKSANSQIKTDLKWVLDAFGFEVVRKKPVDYEIEIVKENYGSGYSSYSTVGSSSRTKSIMAVTLTIVDDEGVEHSFRGMGEYSYQQYYSGYYQHTSFYQDPQRFAAKIAAAHAVAEMIIKLRIPYRRPKK